MATSRTHPPSFLPVRFPACQVSCLSGFLPVRFPACQVSCLSGARIGLAGVLNLNERQIMATLTATDPTLVEQLMEVEGKAEIVNREWAN
jgi:hypothetical protein